MDEQTWAIAIAVLFLMGLVERYTPGRPIRPVEEEPPIRTGAFTRRLRLRALSRASTDPGASVLGVLPVTYGNLALLCRSVSSILAQLL